MADKDETRRVLDETLPPAQHSVTKPGTEEVEIQITSPAQTAATGTESADNMEMPRKSERTRTLTEGGRELQEEKLKKAQRQYQTTYDRWWVEAGMPICT